MRRSIPKTFQSNSVIGRSISATFSTSSGRGRSTPFQFTIPQYDDASPPQPQPPTPPQSHGRGRGQPLSFSNTPRIFPNPVEHEKSNKIGQSQSQPAPVLPTDIINVLSGAGRGKVVENAQIEKPKVEKVENRHVRPRPQQTQERPNVEKAKEKSNEPQLTQEEKVKKAIEILSRCGDGGYVGNEHENTGSVSENTGKVRENMREKTQEYNTRGSMERGRGDRGRGRGTGRGRGRERVLSRGDRERNEDSENEEEIDMGEDTDTEDEDDDFNIGDDKEGEKMAQKVGPEVMDQLVDGFEEAFERVLPDPEDDEYKDALETNLMLECDPEYFMGEFTTNPDIDDKPIIPLRDALEKMKPFLMAHVGIQSHEEWEAVIEETMKTVPLMKKIVDDYGGPDRATAKQQQAELERVAKTLPASAPDSVRRFTERAVLSLQSNPGWGFDKKCQYMDKLVMEASQQYK